jgi:CheY-like chemotaxis protein
MQGGKGSGLGLSFCKTIVELHGGEIGVNSIKGHGTTFKFIIPIKQYEKHTLDTKLATHGSQYISPNHRRTKLPFTSVLVVDDSPTNRKLLKQLLLLFSFDVCEADDGQKAVDIVQQDVDRIKIVFLDNHMPIMDGLVAAQELRKCKYNNLIFGLTGNTFKEDIDSFLEAGANFVFAKPFTKQKVRKIYEFVKYSSCNVGTVVLKETNEGLLFPDEINANLISRSNTGIGIGIDPSNLNINISTDVVPQIDICEYNISGKNIE